MVPISGNRILPHIALGTVLPAEGRMLSFLTLSRGRLGFFAGQNGGWAQADGAGTSEA